MNAPAKIAVRLSAALDAETSALVVRVAGKRGMSEADYAAQAIRRAAESDDDFDAFLQVGIDAADRGELVEHDVVMRELDEMIEQHRAR